MLESEGYWIAQYEKRGALWIHGGNSEQPHAELTGGMHSDGFFNSELVLEHPVTVDEACEELLEMLMDAGLHLEEPDRVVGPAMGAITLADGLGRHIDGRRERPCYRAYTEKTDDGKEMVFKKTRVLPGEAVLIVEDVSTTGGSVEMTAAAVRRAGGIVLPCLATLVNRSESDELDGRCVVSLIRRYMPKWTSEECPLCKSGSVALRPKEGENWKRLTRAY